MNRMTPGIPSPRRLLAHITAAVLAATCLAVTAVQSTAQVPLAPQQPPSAEPDAHSLGVPKDAGAPAKPKDKVLLDIYKLKEKKDEPAFVELRDKARTLGATDEELLEAELTFCFRGLLWDRLKDVGARFAVAVPKWNTEKAAYLRTPGQPEAMNELVQAVLAAEAGDMKTFENHIKQAVWLNPEEASFYSQFIMSYRRKAKMASVTVPMDTKFATSDGKTITLGEIVKGKKAILLAFWATFTQDPLGGIREMADVDKQIASQGVVSVGINIDPNAQVAEQVRTEQKITYPWLVEAEGRPLYSKLGHTSFPMSALITPEGKLLYLGDPMEDDIGLKEALEKVGVKYKLPTDEIIPEP